MPRYEKIGIVHHGLLAEAGELANDLASKYADGRSWWLATQDTLDERGDDLKSADLIITIGGDGTMLSCSRKYGLKGIPVLGINLGNLGFLNDIPPEELTSSLTKILDGEYSEDNRFFLEASLKGKKTIALNEVVIHSGEIAQLIEYDLFINDSFVYRQKADGLIISSPTGSTAYSLSGGGPIVHPKVKSIMISPMLPLSLSSSSLLVESESKIRVNLVKGSKKAHISFDSQGRFLLEANEEIHLSKSSSCLKLLKFLFCIFASF